MRTIRASEIGAYLYCQRAWWYQAQGRISQNIPEMTDGIEFHRKQSREALTAGCLGVLAYALILLSLALGAVYLTRILI